ncbi:MAG: hypothetical protein WC312_00950, partial [Candidatus Omnitrophota bacterium]
NITLIFMLIGAVLRPDFVYPQDNSTLRLGLSYGADNTSKASYRFNKAVIASNEKVKEILKKYNEEIQRISKIQKTGYDDIEVYSRHILIKTQGSYSRDMSYAVEDAHLWPDEFYLVYYDFASLFNASQDSISKKDGFRMSAMQDLLRFRGKDYEKEFLKEIMRAVAFNQLRKDGTTDKQIKNIEHDEELLYRYYAIMYQMWTDTVKWLAERQGPENTLNLKDYYGDAFIFDVCGTKFEKYLEENNLVSFDIYRQIGYGRYYALRGSTKETITIFNKVLAGTNNDPPVIELIIEELFWMQEKGIPGPEKIAEGIGIKFIEDCVKLKELEAIMIEFGDYYVNKSVSASMDKFNVRPDGYGSEIAHFTGPGADISMALGIAKPALKSFLKHEIETGVLIDKLNEVKEKIEFHMMLIQARVSKDDMDGYVKLLLKSQGDENKNKRALGKYMSEHKDFREFYGKCMGKYYEHVETGYKRCVEIIDYFKEKTASMSHVSARTSL